MSTGWPAVRDKCRDLGITFRAWQDGAGRLILAKRADGKYASTIGGIGLSIPRQVGKTFLIGAIVFALCILHPNLTVLWTAHRLRTAEETFGKMQAFAKRRKIRPYVSRIVLGSGEEAVLFGNGSRILFGARERGFGLGFDEVDIEVFDEAQRLAESALDDMIPATNQSRQPTGALVLFMGTPPRPTDPGEVFTRMRTEALSGEDGDTGWIEFGADPDFRPTPAPAPLTRADWEQVAKANPSFPADTPREAILRMRKKLGPESFLREGLGIWDEKPTGIRLPNWSSLVDAASQALDPVAFAVDMAVDRSWTAISASGRRADERMHGVVIDYRSGTDWVVDRIFELVEKWNPCAFALDPDSPAGSLVKPLEERGLVTKCGCHGEQGVMLLTARDKAQACGGLFDDCQNDRFRHLGQPHLDFAVEKAETKPAGDAWAWSLRHSPVDIAPLRSLTWARHAFLAHAQPEAEAVPLVAWR